MSYLFLVTIGPVQDFIAAGRRTGDLASGSWLLSEMARAVACQIVQENGLESLIFPAPTSEDELKSEIFNVANRILARVEQNPKELAEQAKNKMISRLHKIKEEAYREIKILLPPANREMADKQIDDLFEFLWVALPYNPQKPNYKEKREQLEALMAARKNTRDFEAVPWEGRGIPKSSIDGQLESVIPDNWYPPRKCLNVREEVQKLYKRCQAGPAERLSGVDLLKRNGSNAGFLSTPHLAVLPFLQRLEVIQGEGLEKAKEAWEDYVKKFREVSVEVRSTPNGHPKHPILEWQDGGMLFEDQLVDMLGLSIHDIKREESFLRDVKNALRHFYQTVDDQFTALRMSKAYPNPYYAILQADGDGMGEVISAQAEHGYERHREFSQALSSFAEEVGKIVREYQGALVFAGGDDVFAFLPLHTVLQCASELAEQFRHKLENFRYQKDQGNQKSPTLSVGIAIVHYLTPLRDARKLAKQAEVRAKSVEGKNALAITINKRSGEEYDVLGSWNSLDDYLEELIGFCRKNAIPGGTAYELRDLVLRLSHSFSRDEEISHKLGEVMKNDALRILHRKLCVPPGKFLEEEAKEVEKSLQEHIEQLFAEESDKGKDGRRKDPSLVMNRFINELIVARTLAEARELAEPKRGESHERLDS